jgi:hypothetical protein
MLTATQLTLLVAAIALFGFLVYRAVIGTSRSRARRRDHEQRKLARRHHQPWDQPQGRHSR